MIRRIRKWWTRWRDSRTGRFIRKADADASPDTTQGTQIQRRVRKFKKDLR